MAAAGSTHEAVTLDPNSVLRAVPAMAASAPGRKRGARFPVRCGGRPASSQPAGSRDAAQTGALCRAGAPGAHSPECTPAVVARGMQSAISVYVQL